MKGTTHSKGNPLNIIYGIIGLLGLFILIFSLMYMLIDILFEETRYPILDRRPKLIPFTEKMIHDNMGCILHLNRDMYIDFWKDDGERVMYSTKDSASPRWVTFATLVDYINKTFGGIEVRATNVEEDV